MTVKFLLSNIKALPFDFDSEVKKFIKAKKDHQSTEGKAAPIAPHNWVEAAVRRVPGSIEEKRADDFFADYEVVDDSPSLNQRKIDMATAVGMQATALMNEITPPLKSRLLSLQVGDVLAIPEKDRSAAHKTILTDHEARIAKGQAIFRHLALLESQIHDLTEATIDAWKAAPFPK